MNKCFTCNEAINKNSTAKSEFSCNHKICTLCLLNLIKTKMCFQQKGAFSYKCQCQKGYLDLSFEDTEKFLINNLSMASPSTECNCPHKNSELVYCKNCKVAICKQCVKSEHLYHRHIEVKKYKEIIKKNVLDKMKFKEYDSFAKYIAENKETIAKEIKEKYNDIINRINIVIKELNGYVKKLSLEKESRINNINTFYSILNLLYKSYFTDLNNLNQKNMNDIRYLSKLKFDFNKIVVNHNETNDKYSFLQEPLAKLSKLISLNDIVQTKFVFKKLNKIHFPYESSSYKNIIIECKSMIRTKFPIGTMSSISNDELAFGSGSVIGDCNDNTIQIFNLKQSKFSHIVLNSKNSVSSIALLSNNRIAAGSFDKSISIINLNKLNVLGVLSGHHSYINSLAQISNDTLASSSSDEIFIWDISKFIKLTQLKGHTDTVYSLSYDPLKSFLYSCSGDKTIKIWDIAHENKNIISLSGHSGNILCLCLLQSHKFLSGAKDQTIRIWSKKKYKCIGTLLGHKGHIFIIKELIDHRVISGSGDKTMRIWSISDMTCVKVMKGHEGSVLALSVLKDGRVASGGKDNCIKIWD